MLLSSKILVFLVGFVIGILLYVALLPSQKVEFQKLNYAIPKDIHRLEYMTWLNDKGINIVKGNLDDLSYATNRSDLKKQLESQLLYDLVHVTCVVFITIPKNAYMIDSTWGPKCNKLIFYSTVIDEFIETNVIPLKNKWQFLCESLRHLWYNNKGLQWVLFSPDDVFVIPENVRYFIGTKDFNKFYYYGHNAVFWQQLYNSDKTSFLLSKGAIHALVHKFNSSESCKMSKGINDAAYNLGKHLSELGIHAGDSRDYRGRERFHIFTLNQLVSKEYPEVVLKNSKTSLRTVVQGEDCCSDTSISFRSPLSDQSYFLTYLLYQVKVFHTGHAANRLQSPEPDEVWKDTVQEVFGIKEHISKISAEKYYDLWNSKINSPERFNEDLKKLLTKE